MMRFLEDLASRQRFGMRPGLETISALMSALGNPEKRVPAVHIAGTNGKGAVAAMFDAALRALGLKVGRYTSPHLVALNERFFLDGRPVDDATLERHAEKIIALNDLSPTFFEALTAVAFDLYAEAGVDYAVLETGLGGRLDATNVCRPELTIITKIGLDHCDWLGSTVERIAAEKAGIIKPGVPVVLAKNEPSVRAVIEDVAKSVGAPFYFAPDLAGEDEIPAEFSLSGTFNRENAVTAIAALKVLEGRDARVTHAALKGFSNVIWPGRFQRVGSYLVDGAHNPPAARALADALTRSFAPASLDLVFGACGDKDVAEVLEILKPFVRKGYAVKTNNPRSLSAEQVADKMTAAGIVAEPCASLAAALEKTAEVPTLVCGSLFLAGEALVALCAYPWMTNRFDPSEKLK